MASLNKIYRILVEDLGSEVPESVRKLLSPINTFFESTYSALNNDLTFRENIRSLYKDFVITTSSTYISSNDFQKITFKNPLKSNLDTVLIAQIREDNDNFIPVYFPTSVSWNEYNKTVTIHFISGLENNKAYRVKLLCF